MLLKAATHKIELLKQVSRWCLLVCLLLPATTPLFAQGDELLPPEQAFSLEARIEGKNLVAEYDIAPGYYMYRERFEFEIESSGARFDTAIMPKGKIKNDEFFGDMEVYRGKLKIILPILFDQAGTLDLKVKTTGQGCADIGVCYPPLRQLLSLNTGSSARILPTAYRTKTASSDNDDVQSVNALQGLLSDITGDSSFQSSNVLDSQPSNSNSLDILQSLGESIGLAADNEIPHPDKAFMLSASLDRNGIVQTDILIYPNTYLYKDKFRFTLVDGSGHSIGSVSLPDGDTKDDEFFGRMEVYHEQVNISIPVISAANASNQYTLAYQYQGCVEDLICYPPITKYLQIDKTAGLIDISDRQPDSSVKTSIASPTAQESLSATGAPPVSEQGYFAQLLQNESLLLIVALFFLAGIGLTFTPCVFPMIPILSSIIAGQGETITTRKAFSLSLVYVLSMATTYAIAGAIVGYYGAEFNIQIWFQDPIILSVFAALFVLLALSMFGFYEIQMPNAIQSRLSALSSSQQGGTLIGVGIMGFLSAIIVGPCITAPLVGALIFISQTQDWQLGGLALFALGLGMGVPLLAVGTSAGKLLPHAGQWMDRVKAIFGVVLLAVAIWLLERFLPTDITMLLIAALVITSSIYMGALETLSETASGWKKLNKGLGIILLIYGAAYLLGAAAGSKDLVQPLKGISSPLAQGPSIGQQAEHVVFRQIKGEQGLQLALANSVAQSIPTMLDFYADWCISCKVMEKYAFTHPDVLRALDRVATLQTDVTDNDAIDTQLMNSLGIYGPPAILFYDAEGREMRHRRVVGEMSGEEFAAHVIKTFQ
ncbi:MAG: thiol:disulfide interchange protein [Gammaproteobacteria bacterium]|nr:MAG: thiol:disulfide interchange protein [Gammaproteobacteria bacterium]